MKKLITLLLSVLMIATCSMTVFAADNSTDDHKTNFTYEVTETYKWAAPADITFDPNTNSNSKSGTLEVTENVIAGDKKLQISITGGQEFKISNGLSGVSEVKRDYTVTGTTAGSLNVGDVALEVASGTNTGSDTLTFELQSVGVQQAGTYTGTLNFSAAIVAA